MNLKADMSSLKPRAIPKDQFSDDTTLLLKEKSTNIKINSTLEPLLLRPTHVVSENYNSSDLVQEKILPVSSCSMIPIFSFLTTTIPFESSPAVVLSSLSIVNSLVTSIKTYMLPIVSPSLGYIAKSESLGKQTDQHLFTSIFNNDDDIYTDIESLPVVMKPDDLNDLRKIDDIAVNLFYKINKIATTTCNEGRGMYLI